MAEPELDADILEGCRRGDPEAQRRVYERYRDRVYSVALHYLRGDHAAALDVTQEVFVKAFRAAHGFRTDARFSTWLYRIAANACIDELRRRRRVVLFGDIPSAIHPAVEPADPTDLSGEVAVAVSRLSPKLRLAVLLRYLDDLSYDEIATALDCSVGTIASRLSRAHAILARQLAHLHPGHPPPEEPLDVTDA